MGTASRTNPRSDDFRGIRPTGVKDGLGRDLHLGDIVLADKLLAQATQPLTWHLVDLIPTVDPRAPAGTSVLRLQATLAFTVEAGAMIPEIVRVATAEEAAAETEAQKVVKE